MYSIIISVEHRLCLSADVQYRHITVITRCRTSFMISSADVQYHHKCRTSFMLSSADVQYHHKCRTSFMLSSADFIISVEHRLCFHMYSIITSVEHKL